MKFTCKINMDNAAFEPDFTYELNKILTKLQFVFSHNDMNRKINQSDSILDSNGNTVGSYKITGKR